MFDPSHSWIQMEDEFIARCGLSEHCLDAIDIIEYVEFPEVDMEIKKGEQVAVLESNIGYHKYLSPVAGRITEINRVLEEHPELMNTDPYGEGWIYKLDVKEHREFEELMSEDEYRTYVAEQGDI